MKPCVTPDCPVDRPADFGHPALYGTGCGQHGRRTLLIQNGKFKILILSDIQDTNTPQQATVDLMNNAIDQTKPDFIALTGDNIAGWWKGVTPEETKAAVDIVGKAINDRKIPFALVFGNHDHEGLCDEQNGMTEEQAKKATDGLVPSLRILYGGGR